MTAQNACSKFTHSAVDHLIAVNNSLIRLVTKLTDASLHFQGQSGSSIRRSDPFPRHNPQPHLVVSIWSLNIYSLRHPPYVVLLGQRVVLGPFGYRFHYVCVVACSLQAVAGRVYDCGLRYRSRACLPA